MSSRHAPPHVPSLASRFPASAFEPYHVEPMTDAEWDAITLERCACGLHFECPDDWHYGADLPCSCTPDCALDGEVTP